VVRVIGGNFVWVVHEGQTILALAGAGWSHGRSGINPRRWPQGRARGRPGAISGKFVCST